MRTETPPFNLAFSRRLQLAIGNRSVNSLAKLLPVSEATLRNYLRGAGLPQINVAQDIAKVCQVDAGWLMTGAKSEQHSESMGTAGPLFRHYDVAASVELGQQGGAEDPLPPAFIPLPAQFSEALLRQASIADIVLLDAQGDSMVPTIQEGDCLAVDISEQKLTEGVYVLVMNGTLLVKRLALTPEGVTVASDNPLYAPFHIARSRVCWGKSEEGAEIVLVGRVIKALQARTI